MDNKYTDLIQKDKNIPNHIDYNTPYNLNYPYMVHQSLDLYHNFIQTDPRYFYYTQQPNPCRKIPIRTLNDEDFIYVNSKQYMRILHRREQRKQQNYKSRFSLSKIQKYNYESRHRHACTRERGKGGRWISKKENYEEANINSNN